MPAKPARKVSKTDVGKREYKRVSTLSVRTAGGRKKLINTKAAKSAAKGRTTRLAKKGLQAQGRGKYDRTRGAALKKGIEGMARRVNLDEETYNRLMEMDEKALDALYQNNGFLFEIAFSYTGVETDPDTGAYVLSEDRSSDFLFLIEQYNRLFPESAV